MKSLIILLAALVAVCKAAPQGGFLGGIGGGGGSNSGSGATPSPKQDANSGSSQCELGCPIGWNRWGLSEHCYLLPPQPPVLFDFWAAQAECKKHDPSAYIAVSSSLAEQAIGSAIALQYAPSWLAYLTDAYFWLGGYTKDGKWYFLDGTDQSGSILFIGAGLATALSPKTNNTCLGADAKTLGLWQTYPCDTPRGAVICEMPQKPICTAERGGILPISQIDFNMETFKSLFPSTIAIPYLDQLLGAAGLDNIVSNVGNSITCFFGLKCSSDGSSASQPLGKDCIYDCPSGWYSYDKAPNGHCYYLPPHEIDNQQHFTRGLQTDAVSYDEATSKCRALNENSYVMVVNSLLGVVISKAILSKLRYDLANPGSYLWLGESTTDVAWTYLDKSEESGNLPMSLASMPSRKPGTFHRGTCLMANLTNGGVWNEVACNDRHGLYFCEMPKQQFCNKQVGGGRNIEFNSRTLDMSVSTLRTLFPRMPDAPFLEEVLQGKGQGRSVDPNQIKANQALKFTLGAGLAYVMCVQEGGGDWEQLKINDKLATVYGEWVETDCKLAKYGFRASATSILSAWSRCYNKGYELAMPVWAALGDNGISAVISTVSGWYPFVSDNQVAAHYAKESIVGSVPIFGTIVDNALGTPQKVNKGTIGSC